MVSDMPYTFLDKSLNRVAIMDTYLDSLWVEKYRGVGNFKLAFPTTKSTVDLVNSCYWVSHPFSKNLMRIENVVSQTSIEDGDSSTITGRSLESILDRRIVLTEEAFKSSITSAVTKLIRDNIIDPVDYRRKIDNFVVPASYQSFKSYTKTATAGRKNITLLQAVEDQLAQGDIGYYVHVNFSGPTPKFEFDMYDGIDHTTSSVTSGYVEFSRYFDNLQQSSFGYSRAHRFTRAYMFGKVGEEEIAITADTTITGLDLIETVLDVSKLTSKSSDGTDITPNEFRQASLEYAQGTYRNSYDTIEYSSEVDPNYMYKFGEHYGLGDMVVVKDPYGFVDSMRVSEVAFSANPAEVSVVPTFKSLVGDDVKLDN